MRDIYRNPILYYIAVPILIALWPLLVWGVYLPKASESYVEEAKEYRLAQKKILTILTLDPDRPNRSDAKSGGNFDYGTAVEQVASNIGIPSTKYRLSTGPMIKSGKQKSQTGRVVLEDIGMVEFAQFLSTLKHNWAALECSDLRLDRRKSQSNPDIWQFTVKFKYTFSK